MNIRLSDRITCEKCGYENSKEAQHCVKCGEPLAPDYYRGIWFKNVVVTLGLFLLPFIILFYITNFEISTNFESQVKHNLEFSVDANARTINAYLEERKADLLSISKYDVASIRNISAKNLLLKRFVEEKPRFDFIAIADRNGNIVFSTNHLKANVGDEEYFRQSLAGSFFNSTIFYSPILDTIAMVISCPFLNRDDEIIGIIFASICLRTFYDLILELGIGKTSEIFLVDDDGNFLSPSRLGGRVLKDKGHYDREPNPHVGDGGVIAHRDYRGKEVLCTYRKFNQFRGYFVSEIDVAEALAPVARLKNAMFIIFLIFGIFLIISSLLFSRQVILLLKRLTSTLKSALDDINKKKNMINTINVELRKRLADCESLSQQISISEEYIKNIINSISSGLIAIDNDKKITYLNEFVKTFTDLDTVAIGTNVYTTFPILRKNEIQHLIEKIFTDKQAFRLRKISVRLNQEDSILSIAGFPVVDEEKTKGATLVINDITEQTQLQAQMADYEKLSALSQLALGAAHEINNPLQGITSYIELLLAEESDVERKQQTKEVLDSAYRISETVRGLLNFARPTPPRFTKLSLNKLVTETISFLQHQPLFKKIVIDKLLSDTVPQITADSNQLRQVLLNIFINAAQAMPQGGTLGITTGKVKYEDYIEIKIADTGIGIAPENLKKVFEPFFTTKKGEGTGLGLSITYSYIKNHNGHITITSEPHKGTQVFIVLPIRQTGHLHSEVVE